MDDANIIANDVAIKILKDASDALESVQNLGR